MQFLEGLDHCCQFDMVKSPCLQVLPPGFEGKESKLRQHAANSLRRWSARTRIDYSSCSQHSCTFIFLMVAPLGMVCGYRATSFGVAFGPLVAPEAVFSVEHSGANYSSIHSRRARSSRSSTGQGHLGSRHLGIMGLNGCSKFRNLAFEPFKIVCF